MGPLEWSILQGLPGLQKVEVYGIGAGGHTDPIEFDKGGGGNLPVGWAADGTSVYSASMVRKWTWLGRWESAI
jgi:hypothetical protein